MQSYTASKAGITCCCRIGKIKDSTIKEPSALYRIYGETARERVSLLLHGEVESVCWRVCWYSRLKNIVTIHIVYTKR